MPAQEKSKDRGQRENVWVRVAGCSCSAGHPRPRRGRPTASRRRLRKSRPGPVRPGEQRGLHEWFEEPALAENVVGIQIDHACRPLEAIGRTPTPFEQDAGKSVTVAMNDHELRAIQDARPAGLLLAINRRVHENLRRVRSAPPGSRAASKQECAFSSILCPFDVVGKTSAVRGKNCVPVHRIRGNGHNDACRHGSMGSGWHS